MRRARFKTDKQIDSGNGIICVMRINPAKMKVAEIQVNVETREIHIGYTEPKKPKK